MKTLSITQAHLYPSAIMICLRQKNIRKHHCPELIPIGMLERDLATLLTSSQY